MSRPERVFVDGVVYHVYNRLARGERVFSDDVLAQAFVDLLSIGTVFHNFTTLM